MLTFTGSRTATAAALLGVAMLAVIRVGRPATWALTGGALYGVGVTAFLARGGVVGHGLRHGTLFHVSLTFRCYWLKRDVDVPRHPWAGVGWDNRAALPRGAGAQRGGRVRDPHNFIVRCFAELGLVGGLLLAWRCACWGAARRRAERRRPPVTRRAHAAGHGPHPAADVVSSGVARAGAAVDRRDRRGRRVPRRAAEHRGGHRLRRVGVRVPRTHARGGFRACSCSGRWSGCSARLNAPPPTTARRVGAVGASSGWRLFLVHNLIDFSLFEPGPMLVFAMMAGAAAARRRGPRPSPSPPGAPRGRGGDRGAGGVQRVAGGGGGVRGAGGDRRATGGRRRGLCLR